MTAWNFKDLTGMKFNRLTVIERAENKGSQTYWKCKCDCGKETIVNAYSLKSGHSKSCGCLRDEKTSKCFASHGLCRTKIYASWNMMKQRCLNPNSEQYPNYGGRGIKVCDEWLDFKTFYDYVSNLPHFGENGYTLDRIDVNGNYEPSNVRWADKKEQGRNKRNNIIVEYEGREMVLKDAAELSGLDYKLLHYRYQRGDRGERLFRPVKK